MYCSNRPYMTERSFSFPLSAPLPRQQSISSSMPAGVMPYCMNSEIALFTSAIMPAESSLFPRTGSPDFAEEATFCMTRLIPISSRTGISSCPVSSSILCESLPKPRTSILSIPLSGLMETRAFCALIAAWSGTTKRKFRSLSFEALFMTSPYTAVLLPEPDGPVNSLSLPMTFPPRIYYNTTACVKSCT